MKLKILFLSLLFPILLFAGKAKKLPPIHFTADQVVATESVTFISGHVKAYVGNYILTADKVALFMNKNKEVYKIKAYGHVKIMGENRFAVGEVAIFYRKSGKVILKGSPRIWEGSDELRGSEIIMFLNKKQIIVKKAKGKLSPSTVRKLEK